VAGVCYTAFSLACAAPTGEGIGSGDKFIPSFAVKYGGPSGWPALEDAARFDLLAMGAGTSRPHADPSVAGNTWQVLKELNPRQVMLLFDAGWAVVNPTPQLAMGIVVPQGAARIVDHDTLERPDSRPLVGQFDLPPHRGIVLLKQHRALGNASGAPGPSTAVSKLYSFSRDHDLDGIGKFYMGREIAKVMGHEASDWLERPERDAEERPGALIDQLQLKAGEFVADIGAGTGYFSRRLAKAVGPTGKVLAEDVQPEMLVLLTNKMATAGLTNVIPVLGTAADAKLPHHAVDLVLLVDVYHEFEFPFEMMSNICRALKPGGRIAFVEYRAEDPDVPIKPLHKMSESQVKKEMALQPVEWIKTIEVLPRQHIIEFRVRDGNGGLNQ
jgi:SAM-dependent methyltransferase